MKKSKAIIIRTYLIYFLVVLAMLLVIGKTFAIIVNGRNHVFTFFGSNLKERTATIPARRGDILDDELNPLVTSVSFYDIYMDPSVVSDKLWNNKLGDLCKGLSRLFPNKSARYFEEYLRNARIKGRKYVRIKRKVSHQMRKKVRALPIFKRGQFEGGLIDNKIITKRIEPNDQLLSRTLGYVQVTKKDTFLVGLEGAYNKYLKGKEGLLLEEKIGHDWKPTGGLVRPAQNGYDIVTSINKDIQEVAHSELEKQLQKEGGKYGVAIVMNVKTGFIKAIVNLHEVGEGEYAEIYNHAVGTLMVPGSTMKLASLLAALEDHKIKLTDTVNADGKYEYYDQVLMDSHPLGYGKITIERAFELSSNVISQVIFNNYKDHPQQYFDRLNQFGITQKTGINIKGEAAPIYSHPGNSSWWGASLAWMAIGYEFRLTPLELLSFYNAVANDGKYMQPQLVTKILNDGEVVKELEPIVKRKRICSQSSIRLMKNAMEGVVENGTGRRLKSAHFKIAGKTGTAQIANNDKGYGAIGERKYMATFVGYFPANNPIYSCLVTVAAPTKDIYGASVSGTVFAAIANKVYATSYQYHDAVNNGKVIAGLPGVQNGSRYDINTVLNHFDIPKTLAGNGNWVTTSTVDGETVKYTDLPINKNQVPDVRGMGLSDALFLLEKKKMKVEIKGFGKVVQQSIPPGSAIVPGELIQLKLK